MKLLLHIFILSLIFATAVSAQYSGCNDPLLDTGGKPCVEVTECSVRTDTSTHLDQANTYYLLTQNISADDSCILINNNDITFDLNEYTITYGTNPTNIETIPGITSGCVTYYTREYGPVCHHGISDKSGYDNGDPRTTPDWYGVSDNGCTNAEIKNGNLQQGSSTTEFSQGIQLSCSGARIHNLTTHVYGRDNMNIRANGNDYEIYGIYATSATNYVTNRHYILAQFKLRGSGFSAYNNTVIGSPQRGIDIAGTNIHIYGNYISQHASYTNNHGVGIYDDEGSDIYIYENYIVPTDGRGISCEHVNRCYIYNNFINVTEAPHAEYGTNYGFTCAHGIKLEGGTRNTEVYNNTVISYTGPGTWGGCPLNIGISSGGPAHVYNNSFTAIYGPNSEGISWATAYLFYGSQENVLIEDNQFYSNNWFLYADGIQPGPTLRNNVFTKTGPDLKTFYSIWMYSYNRSSENIRIVNSSNIGDDWTNVHIRDYYMLHWNYSVDWLTTIDVQDGGGTPLDANVEIRDATNQLVFSGTTGSDGVVVANLREFSIDGTSNTVQNQFDFTPHTITVNYNGDIQTRAVTVDNGGTELFTYDYSGITLSIDQCEQSDGNPGACDFAYNDLIEEVYVTCTDADGVNSVTGYVTQDGTIVQVMDYSTGGPSGRILNAQGTTVKSGDWAIVVNCTDNAANTATRMVSWSVPYGTVSVTHDTPSNGYGLYNGQSFTYGVTYTCANGDCGTITSTLDPFDDSGWQLAYQETFDTSRSLNDGDTFGTDGWLTAQLLNGGDISIPGDGIAYVSTPDFWNAALIHSTDVLPEEWKLRVKTGNINYEWKNYDQTDRDNPAFYNQNENGIYLITVTDALCSGSQCAENWWHYHRKSVIDVDDHQGQEHPLYMVWMDPATNSGGNLLRTWRDGQWYSYNWNWEVAYTYALNTFYIAEMEKHNDQLTLRLYDASENLMIETDPVDWNDVMGNSVPEYFYTGEPHTDDYEGSAQIDDITLLVPTTQSKGMAIPEGAGSPFYTTNSNPQTCANMQGGDSCSLTWTVYANGVEGVGYTFLAQATSDVTSVGDSAATSISILASSCTEAYNLEPCVCFDAGELVNSILGWYSNSIDLTQLLTNIAAWKGPGC